MTTAILYVLKALRLDSHCNFVSGRRDTAVIQKRLASKGLCDITHSSTLPRNLTGLQSATTRVAEHRMPFYGNPNTNEVNRSALVRLFWVVIACLLGCCLVQAKPDPARVVVVANASDRDSMRIAQSYLAKRGIPEKNLITLQTDKGRMLTWPEFTSQIYNPLQKALQQKGFIEATIADTVDNMGRQRAVVLSHEIDFLVLCRLPYQIEFTNHKSDGAPRGVQSNAASVDSELALICRDNLPVDGPLRNPLFGQARPNPLVLQQVIKVFRLDGPSVEAVERMLDGVLLAERYGLRGRSYIDPGGPVAEGDVWMNDSGKITEVLNFPTTYKKTGGRYNWQDRMDGAAFYLGWYSANADGPFADAGFRFPPGAVTYHLHSFSATDLRDRSKWCGAMVHAGCGFTAGNVFEPRLGFVFRPDVMMKALASGMCMGDAAYAATPTLSWMTVLIGDPLYQPFEVSLEAQVARVRSVEATDMGLDQYVVLREMQRRINDADVDSALDYGKAAFTTLPGRALAFDLSYALNQKGKASEIKTYVGPFLASDTYAANEIGLSFRMARLLQTKAKERDLAFQIDQRVLDSAIAESSKSLLLKPAANNAARIGEVEHANAWDLLHTRLKQTK